jgi:15-cis-phytoene synthase
MSQSSTEQRDNHDPSALDASTFNAPIRLLPTDLQHDARQLYRMLRTIDDLVDTHDPQATSRVQAVERWTRNQYADTPETHILDDLAERHPVPRHAIAEFCQGMRHDLVPIPIETEDDLERYCQQAGGSIGIVLANIFGTSHPDGETNMAALGRAFQHTNILRDIDEDRTHGRLYIAHTTIQRYGPPTLGARKALLKDQIVRADQLYEQGLRAIPLLRRGQRAMALSAALYREILRQIERTGYGNTSQRVTVPTWRRRLLYTKHRLASRSE